MSTLTSVPVPRVSREITVSYLGELLRNAGFIDDRQKGEVDNLDKQFRAQVKEPLVDELRAQTIERGREALISYRFGSGAADHLFCGTCGVKSFYQPRSHPDRRQCPRRRASDGS